MNPSLVALQKVVTEELTALMGLQVFHGLERVEEREILVIKLPGSATFFPPQARSSDIVRVLLPDHAQVQHGKRELYDDPGVLEDLRQNDVIFSPSLGDEEKVRGAVDHDVQTADVGGVILQEAARCPLQVP